MGKWRKRNAKNGRTVVEAALVEADDREEIFAQFDGTASAAIVIRQLRKRRDGLLEGAPEDGNLCIIYVSNRGKMSRISYPASEPLTIQEWRQRIKEIVRSCDGCDQNTKLIAWTIQTLRFYRLQVGDVFLDTRFEKVRYAVVPSRRVKKSRRISN